MNIETILGWIIVGLILGVVIDMSLPKPRSSQSMMELIMAFLGGLIGDLIYFSINPHLAVWAATGVMAVFFGVTISVSLLFVWHQSRQHMV